MRTFFVPNMIKEEFVKELWFTKNEGLFDSIVGGRDLYFDSDPYGKKRSPRPGGPTTCVIMVTQKNENGRGGWIYILEKRGGVNVCFHDGHRIKEEFDLFKEIFYRPLGSIFDSIAQSIEKHFTEMKVEAIKELVPEPPPSKPQAARSGDEIPAILLNREVMKQYRAKGFTYSPATARQIIDKLIVAQQEAVNNGEKLTVTTLANKVGCNVETVSRYLSAFKKAGYSELIGVKLPGQQSNVQSK